MAADAIATLDGDDAAEEVEGNDAFTETSAAVARFRGDTATPATMAENAGTVGGSPGVVLETCAGEDEGVGSSDDDDEDDADADDDDDDTEVIWAVVDVVEGIDLEEACNEEGVGDEGETEFNPYYRVQS